MKYVSALSAVIIGIMLTIFLAPTADASLLANPFGGKIIWKKALQIQVLEATGFVCIVFGKTIQILPTVKSFPKSYFIPTIIKNKTNVPISIGQSILGLYGVKIPIVCTNAESGVTKTVNLSTVTLFGTSKK